MQRIFTLTGYFVRSFFWSLAGLIYVIVALVFWNLFFTPAQGTPHIENYILIIGAFGVAISFLVTLSISARANQAAHFPLVTRLTSRAEYLTAVLLSSVISAMLLQLLVAVLAMFKGPGLVWRLLEIPPLWIAVNVFTAVLAMHASDFVTVGWSRVTLFGIVGFFLLGQSAGGQFSNWSIARLGSLSQTVNRMGWYTVAEWVNNASQWLSGRETGVLHQIYNWLIWPFAAIPDAIINGFFNSTQALAPAVILLYATVLFLLAADLFAGKDLEFTE